MKKRTIKKTALSIVAAAYLMLCAWALVGCDVAPGRYEELVANVNNGMTTIAEAVKESGFVKDEKMDRLAEDMATVKNAAMAAAIKLDEQEAEDQFVALLEAAQAANTASLLLNPYAAPIGGVLSIALAVAGVMAKKNGDKAKKSGNAVREIVAGIETFKRSNRSEGHTVTGAEAVTALKDALRASTVTSKTVIAEARN